MSIRINADVVDLTQDSPKGADVFFVDSNVWFWVGYSKASLVSKYNQSNDYPDYINRSLLAGSRLYKCTLSFAELAHSVERNERDIFNSNRTPPVGTKEFRHNFPVERQRVVSEIEDTWQLAEAMTAGLTIEAHLTSAMISSSIRRIKQEGLDGYDVFMLEALKTSGITQIITDDSDFAQVAGIIVFTANKPLIRQAKKQRKLLIRP